MRTKTNRIVLLLVLATLMAVSPPNLVWAREWSNRQGQRLEADFLAVHDEQLHVRRAADNTVLRIPVETLSDGDQEFLSQHAAAIQAAPFYMLVTKSNKTYAGVVVDDKEISYTIQLRDGSNSSVAKRLLSSITSGVVLRKQVTARLAQIDQQNDGEFQELYDSAHRWATMSELEALVNHVFQTRFEAAKANPDKLTRLANWSDGFGAVELARRCRQRLMQLEFEDRLGAAGADKTRLVELAVECRRIGMPELFQTAAEAARKAAPGDARVLDSLAPSPWKIRIADVKRDRTYVEQLVTDKYIFTPKGGRALIHVKLQIQLTRPSPLSYEEQLAHLAKRTPASHAAVIRALRERAAEIKDSPGRFFSTTEVKLKLNNGDFVTSSFTSLPPGNGISHVKTAQTKAFTRTRHPVIYYYRAEDLTAMYLAPEADLTITLLFAVPSRSNGASLRVYDLPPLSVRY